MTDSIAALYIHSQLAEAYFYLNNYNEALNNYNLAISPALKYNKYDFAADLYFTKSRILFNRAKFDSALYYAKLSEDLADSKFNSLSFSARLTNLIAHIYEKLQNKNEQLIYYKKAYSLSDSLFRRTQRMQDMQLLAKSDYDKMETNLENQKRENLILLFGSLILLILLSAILYYLFKLRAANLALVKKSLVSADEINKNSSNDEENHNQYSQIISLLTNEMNKNNIFLQKDLTIQKVAEVLGTNRTYLSKAINNNLKMNFVNYINNLRIKESINLIRNGKVNNYKIAAIADCCGFNSRSAFINAFKAFTGVTPSFFIDNLESADKQINADKIDDDIKNSQ